MKTGIRTRSTLALAAAVLMTSGLVACGGDGDGALPAPSVTLDLTDANRDTVAHATATGVMSFGASMAVPFGADAGVGAQAATSRTLSNSGSRVSSQWLPLRVAAKLAAAVRGSARLQVASVARPLMVINYPPESCNVSGSTTTSVDDVDNDGKLSVGDTFIFVFNDCQDSAWEVLNGTITAVFTRMGASSLPSFGARMTLAQLSQVATDGRHGLALNGSVLLDYEQLSSTAETMNMTADGAVMATVSTHLPYNDTVVLQSGFVQNSRFDYTLGRVTSTVQGVMESANAGGTFAISTLTQIEADDTEAYPRAGVLKMVGRTGTMMLSALSAAQVRVDLDANDDGIYESGVTQTWDWLL